MMKNSSKVRDKKPQYERLFQRMEIIEREWDTYKRLKSRSKSSRIKRPGSKSSEHSSIVNSLEDQILQNSPRSLMSCLQESERKSPAFDDDQEGLVWKVRTNDITVQEILRDRMADYASGKLKGRRLNWDSSKEDGEDICSECFDYLCHQESTEVRSLRFYGSDNEDECFDDYFGGNDETDSYLNISSSSEDPKTEQKLSPNEEEEEMERNNNHHHDVGERRSLNFGGKNGGRWRPGMAWLVLVTMALTVTLGLISMSCGGGILGEEKVFLIPT